MTQLNHYIPLEIEYSLLNLSCVDVKPTSNWQINVAGMAICAPATIRKWLEFICKWYKIVIEEYLFLLSWLLLSARVIQLWRSSGDHYVLQTTESNHVKPIRIHPAGPPCVYAWLNTHLKLADIFEWKPDSLGKLSPHSDGVVSFLLRLHEYSQSHSSLLHRQPQFTATTWQLQ